MKYLLLSVWLLTFSVTAIEVELANDYHGQQPLTDYLVSEKYDGVRAIWTGNRLVSRQGNPIYAPSWFTASLPGIRLDGELWSGRGEFSFISSTVLDQQPDEKAWRKISFMVFDAPDSDKTFAERYRDYSEMVAGIDKPHVRAVTQFTVASEQALSALLERLVAEGAEGLMLHKADARFAPGRSDNLLKLKPFMDAEAVVVGHLPGKGKFDGKLGALLVEMPDGTRFRLGTGFSDVERENPPPLGTRVTYQYHGLTKNGVPKFASFLRVRKAE